MINENLRNVVDTLAKLDFESFVLLDKAEPEFKAFAKLLSRHLRPQLVALLGVCTGLIDYQLAHGGAARLWEELENVATGLAVDSIDDVRRCMQLLLQRPVCAKYNEQKVERIAKLFSSNVPVRIEGQLSECAAHPTELWNMIADAVQSPPEKKTIAFAMKAFDLATFCTSGRYLEFEKEPPMAVDFHVRRISEILGLVPPGASDDDVRRTWFIVSSEASKKTGKNISPLRIDSLIWQTGVLTYDPVTRKHSKSRIKQLQTHLTGIGIEQSAASVFLQLLRSRPF